MTATPTTPTPAAAPAPGAPDRNLRWRIGAVAAVGLLGAHLAGLVALPTAGPGPEDAYRTPPAADLRPTATPTTDTGNPVTAEQQRALAHLRSTGTLDTWRPVDPRVIGAGAGSTAVLSGIADGVCWYGAIDGGLATEVAVDDTQAACTAAAVDAARAELTSAGAAARADADARAASRLAVAVEGAKMWASTNYVDGMPSFAGLPGEVAPGVFTVNHTTVEVVLEARTGDGGCARAAVTAAGFVTELDCL